MTREEQREKTRRELIRESTALFAKKGIISTTTAEVAKATKVSHGTVFIHFPTRNHLILEVVKQFGVRLSSELNRRLGADADLREMLQTHLDVLSEFEDFYLRIICESQSLPGQTKSLVYAINASLSYRFFRLARTKMLEGKIKKLGQASFFNSWMSLIHYNIMNRDIFADKVPILRYKGKEILRLFFLLIETKEEK